MAAAIPQHIQMTSHSMPTLLSAPDTSPPDTSASLFPAHRNNHLAFSPTHSLPWPYVLVEPDILASPQPEKLLRR